MRVAIAGGNGFIGRELTRQLLAEGRDVVWLSHTPGRVQPPELVTEVAFDHRDLSAEWAHTVRDADAVVNLSGYPIASRWNAERKRLLRESRVDTNRALISALGEPRVQSGLAQRVFVCASGIGVYGDRGEEVLTEATPPGDDFLGRLAADWESSALAAASIPDVRAACVRTGLVLGEEGLVPRLALPMKLFVGGPVGFRRQWLGWIHIEDIAAVYRHVLGTAAIEGPVNAVADPPVTMRELSSALGRAMRRPSWLPVPGLALRLVLGEVAPYMQFSQRAQPTVLRNTGFAYRHPDLTDALADALTRMKTR